jgi:hypothetical protein
MVPSPRALTAFAVVGSSSAFRRIRWSTSQSTRRVFLPTQGIPMAATMPGGSDTVATAAEEVAGLDRVLTRLALTDDDKLEKVPPSCWRRTPFQG